MRQITIKYLLVLFISFFIFSFSIAAEEKEAKVDYEAGFYYTVKKGDTLWDLSQHFSDSAWLWPELWGENGQLTNPHWIYPGQRIRLFQKNWVDQVVIPEKAPAEPPPPPEESVYFLYPSIDTVGFLRKQPFPPSGTIFSVQDNKELISNGDIVYVHQIGPVPFKKDALYTVYRTMEPPKGETGKRYKGVQHYLTGKIRITRTESDYAIAQVIHSLRTISIGDYLMPYYPKSPEISLVNSIIGLDGQIIFSEEQTKIIGDNTIVFINRGKDDGVKPGQFYRIYYQEKRRIDPKKHRKTLLDPVDFGQLLVLHTEDTTSTVLITKAEKSIAPGTRIRGMNP